ncbi:MAG: type II toxin-antitoxin system VapC family toxin [Rubrivivax sp.]
MNDLLRLPMSELQAAGAAEMDAAYAAFVACGKGIRQPAELNFGDLFSYVMAEVRGLPLLFKGDDFARTDIQPAWPRQQF